MRTLLLCLILLAISCATQPVSWTPELVDATQKNFELAGTWRHAVRSGAQFGKTCDLLFEADGSYRKACKPPFEERGEWERVGEWDAHSFTLRLTERVDILEKKPIDDAEYTVSVDAPTGDVISFDGESYERL